MSAAACTTASADGEARPSAAAARSGRRPAGRRTDVPARAIVASVGRARVGALLDELDELLDAADLGAEHEHVAERDGEVEAGAHGVVRTASRSARRRRDVGADPLAVGEPAERRRVGPHEPEGERDDADAARSTARIGVAAASPRSSISHLASGVSRMPPTDSPVDATDRATERRRVVPAGDHRGHRDSPAPANPTANTAYTA